MTVTRGADSFPAMRIFRHYEELPEEARGAVVAIGNFDGVHLGHQAVIREAGRIARASGFPWAALTFEPHPRSVFGAEAAPFRLTPFRTKARHIKALGVDILVALHFDLEFAERTAEAFVDDILVNALGARHVVSGYDFVFGHGRKGNCESLLHMGGIAGFGFTCVRPVEDDAGEAYSSTRVRRYLIDGNPRAAAEVLGRPFEIEGRVEKGAQRGHDVGFPTANLHLGEYQCPMKGVYAIRAGIDIDGETAWRDGVANLGERPTFDGKDTVLEPHIFDFHEDLYGRHLRVELIEYLRPEKKFDGIEALRTQIAKDCEQARKILAG